MEFWFSCTIELGDDETPESLAQRCQNMDCPCEYLLSIDRCPLGAYEVNGLCRLVTQESWEQALQQERFDVDM